MSLLTAYSNTIHNVFGSKFEGFARGQRQLVSASEDYVASLSAIILSGDKSKDPSAYAFSKLLAWSRFLSSYTSVIETLEDLAIEVNLEEFQGEF